MLSIKLSKRVYRADAHDALIGKKFLYWLCKDYVGFKDISWIGVDKGIVETFNSRVFFS